MARPSRKVLGKRKAPPEQHNGAKKAKHAKSSRPPTNSKPSKASAPERELGPTGKPKRRPDQPKKVKLRDQKFIPVPQTEFDNAEESDELLDLGEEDGLDVLGSGGAFLRGMDQCSIRRTAKETQRIHDLEKSREQMPLKARTKLRLPSPGTASTMSDYGIDSDDDLPSLSGVKEHMGGLSDGMEAEEEGEGQDEDLAGEGSGSGSGSSVYDSGGELDDDEGDEDVNGAYDDVEYLSEGSEGSGDGFDNADDAAEDGEDESGSDEDDDSEADMRKRRKGKAKTEGEAEYELSGRSRWTSKSQAEQTHVEVGRLPIKLPSGKVQAVEGSTKIALPKKKAPHPAPESEVSAEEEEEDEGSDGDQAQTMAGQKGRFGRMGVAEIVGKAGWKNAQKLEAAKEQIAVIGAEILAGGELIDNGPLLTRLSTFALPTVPSLEDGHAPLPVPHSIRGLALLSQLAVYKDLIPGYRIRQLTALEEAEKVRDEVRRLREGEKMLVRSYKGYLKMLESEVKRRTPLATVSLRCMADLLASVPHFNFSENIMGVLVGRVGRRSWDEDSDLVLQTLITVFKGDITATHSQTLVRLLARMIKERKFQVHPNILSCLLHLRLRSELDKMKEGKSKAKGQGADAKSNLPPAKFKSELRRKWATKNQKQREKDMKEEKKVMAEAEAEVDKEERAVVQTETLKNLFVLYFSVLKHPGRSPLLPAALEGTTHFGHFINVDFFRDLLAVLRKLIVDEDQDGEREGEGEDAEEDEKVQRKEEVIEGGERVRLRLLGIVTAFELLSGQGEAINIDLSDFINQLFALLRPLALDTSIEDPPLVPPAASSLPPSSRPLVPGRAPPKSAYHTQSTSALLFRSLHAIFFSRSATAAAPPHRSAAFAKRLVESALTLPPATARQALEFVRALMGREPRLESMLDTEERTFDGVYKPEMDDPQLANPFATSLWEVEVLARGHWDAGVREVAGKLVVGNLV